VGKNTLAYCGFSVSEEEKKFYKIDTWSPEPNLFWMQLLNCQMQVTEIVESTVVMFW